MFTSVVNGPMTASPVGEVMLIEIGEMIPDSGFVMVPRSMITFPEKGSAPSGPGNALMITTVFPF
jgi:hypothetical protein